ncbi:MAG: type II toxin-antitoxin system VapC family toxin [Betaproteobacteria bacterium]|nr:type II toxin-antitoxin system VapC family toxin [Betaproteobacteria bacterium]
MRLLLDTHILLWMLDDSPRLGRGARELMGAPGAECFVSAISFWEIAIKMDLRRKDFRVDVDSLVDACVAAGLRPLPFMAAHAVRVARLPRHHADPFDRALVAQALTEPLTLLTRDAKLARYGSVVRVA